MTQRLKERINSYQRFLVESKHKINACYVIMLSIWICILRQKQKTFEEWVNFNLRSLRSPSQNIFFPEKMALPHSSALLDYKQISELEFSYAIIVCC